MHAGRRGVGHRRQGSAHQASAEGAGGVMNWNSLTPAQRIEIAERAQTAWCAVTDGVPWADLDDDGRVAVVRDVEDALAHPARYGRAWVGCVRKATS